MKIFKNITNFIRDIVSNHDEDFDDFDDFDEYEENETKNMKSAILIIVQYKINEKQSSKLRLHYTDTSNMTDEELSKETQKLENIIQNLNHILNDLNYRENVFIKIDGCLIRRDSIISVVMEYEY